MERYILAHDLGTSGNKATLYALDGSLVKSFVASYPLSVSEANTAEQDADGRRCAELCREAALRRAERIRAL